MIICYQEHCNFNKDQECDKNTVVMTKEAVCLYFQESQTELSESDQIKREYLCSLKTIKKLEELLKECECYCPCMQKHKISKALRGEFDE